MSPSPRLRITAIACLSLALAGCGGSSSDGGPPPVSPAQTVEGSAPVAVSTVDSLLQLPADTSAFVNLEAALILGKSAFRGARRPALDLSAALRLEGGSAALAARVDCEAGGSVDATCALDGSASLVRASFSSCRFTIPLFGTAEFDGGFAAVVGDPLFCANGETDATTRVDYRFSDFVALFEGSDGNTSRLAIDLFQAAAPTGAGCAFDEDGELVDGALLMDGSILIESEEPPRDLAIRADRLRYDLVSTGDPCLKTLTVNGRATIHDRLRGRRFSQAFDDLVVTVEEDPAGGGCITIDGAVENPCLGGRVVFQTLERICYAPGDECPTSGLLQVAPPGGAPPGTLRFTPGGGVEIDVEGDGVIDRTLSDCHAADASLCAP